MEVFATRSPRRPNPIGLTIVELLRREGRELHVRGVDMLDGTPILDIKPLLSGVPLKSCDGDGWRRRRRGKVERGRRGDLQANEQVPRTPPSLSLRLRLRQ